MRVEYIGHKVPHVGKTMWEIVGNLKNFGVGRLVKKCFTDKHPGVSFFKILKVQPLPPPKREGENRRVMIWCDEVYKNKLLGEKFFEVNSEIPKYQLIPKIEEEEYLQKAAKLGLVEKRIKKYYSWPPLYKKLWEEESKTQKPIPKLKTIFGTYAGVNLIFEEDEYTSRSCSLYKGNQTVEEMYKEIVHLKKIIKSHKDSQQ